MFLVTKSCGSNIKPTFSSAYINWAHPLSQDLIAAWFFTGLAGRMTWDLSPYHNHGTIEGGNWVSTIKGPAVSLNGVSTDFISVPDVELLDLIGDFTIIMWVIPKTGAYYAVALNKKDSTWNSSGGYIFYHLAAGGYCDFVGKDSSYIRASFPIQHNILSQYAVTYTGGIANLYFNGEYKVGGAVTQPVPVVQDLWIGKRNPSTAGYADNYTNNVLFFRRALSTKEILENYQNKYAILQQRQILKWLPIGGLMPQLQGVNLGNDLFNGTFLG